MDETELTTPRLYAVACRLTNPVDIRNLGHQLGVKEHTIDAAFYDHRYCIQEAAYTVLKNWFRGQENCKVAFVTLKRALSHPTVNLSKISKEVLTTTSVYLTKEFDDLLKVSEDCVTRDTFESEPQAIPGLWPSIEYNWRKLSDDLHEIKPLQGKFTERVLCDTLLELLSHELTKYDIYRLALQGIESSFAKFCTNKKVAIQDILTTWFKRQNSREEAFRKLVEALVHPDVGLNLVAREVLHFPLVEPDSMITNRPKLEKAHLVNVSRRLDKDEMYRLGQKLGIPSRQMNASFMKFCTSEKDAILHFLSRWLKRQNNRQEAYLVLGDAMIHPDVGLNLIAKEVLGYSK